MMENGGLQELTALFFGGGAHSQEHNILGSVLLGNPRDVAFSTHFHTTPGPTFLVAFSLMALGALGYCGGLELRDCKPGSPDNFDSPLLLLLSFSLCRP